MSNVIDNLLRYVAINTRSDDKSKVTPSTPNQMKLAKLLQKELEELGLTTELDDHAYLFGTLPSNIESETKTIAFLAHLDTANFNSENVNPRVIEYKGGDIELNEGGKTMAVRDFPNLASYIGQRLVVTDGTTLLGADDKAGIAEIMAALKILKDNPTIPHGEIKVAFTPDEEIGRGPALFDVEKLGADLGYTVDGGPLGELQFENFNAASADITVRGRSVHPGSAKNKMKNAILIACEFNAALPAEERPEHTEGYEGFFHLDEMNGRVEETILNYIIRDHDMDKFQAKKERMNKTAQNLNKKYGEGTVEVTMSDSYYNMKEKIEPYMYIVENAKQAFEMAGVQPQISPVRGGTDGAQLSYKGLPCPNIFTGGENFHGEFEFISVESMEKAVEVILNIIAVYAENQFVE
ncbi:MAG: peptidase T [Clostridium sp.]|nr:peptidase T [Clostridium sp.]